MVNRFRLCGAFALGVCLMVAAHGDPAVVLYGGNTIAVEKVLPDPSDLWVSPGDLERINGFVLKPEGACFEDICIPIRQSEDSDLFVTRDGGGWINATELARKLNQAYVADSEHGVWSFGEVPAAMGGFLESAEAPDFELTDRSGKTVRLSDFRGKKVLLITWASW